MFKDLACLFIKHFMQCRSVFDIKSGKGPETLMNNRVSSGPIKSCAFKSSRALDGAIDGVIFP